MTTDNPQEQSAKNAHYPEPGYTHPDEMPIVEERPNHHSDLRGMIVHFTSEMLDNQNNYGIYPTTNFYNDLEEAILDWHKKHELEARLNEVQNAYEHWINGRKFISSYFRDRIAVLSDTKESKDE